MKDSNFSIDVLPNAVASEPAAPLRAARPAPRFRSRQIKVALSLLACDLMAVAFCWFFAIFLNQIITGTAGSNLSNLLILLAPVIFCSLGLYDGTGPSPVERFRLRGLGTLIVMGMNAAATTVGGSPLAGMGIAGVSALLLLVISHYGELIARARLIARGIWSAPAAIVGLSGDSQKLAQELISHPEYGLRPIGFVDNGTGERVWQRPQQLHVLGSLQDMPRLASSIEVVLVIKADDRVLDELAASGCWPPLKLIVAQHALESRELWLNGRSLGDAFGLELKRALFRRRNLWLKRGIDLCLAVPLLILALPVIALLAIAIKLIDPGPAFYRQSRVGYRGRLIEILKLRSMYSDAAERLKSHLESVPAAALEWKAHFKLSNDPRILPFIGGIIRKSSLDELPQLLNIVRGDMSLIGPRPFPEYHLSAFDREFAKLRASVPPGLTGLWQVSCRSDGDLALQRHHDTFYIRNWSIWLDLYVLLQTVPVVLSAKGAR